MSETRDKQSNMATTKLGRATQFGKAGIKVGGNYLKYYAKKAVGVDDRAGLHEDNASDIYETLSELKGSALKVLQMLSLDDNILPQQYIDRFSLSHFKVPSLSYPLVVKTFKQELQKHPNEIFESFSHDAVAAASIGQVHKATKDGKTLAVKIQYPGVADSIKSDLTIVKPFAKKLFKITSEDLDYYLEEVQDRLLEETDYQLEISRSVALSEACEHLTGIKFPTYYPEYSSKRIITMDWLDGKHLDSKVRELPRERRNFLGQCLWDFYHYSIHDLRKTHADPHPGNFLINEDSSAIEDAIGILDFGCVKELRDEFYFNYFKLMKKEFIPNEEIFYELGFLYDTDNAEERKLFTELFSGAINLLSRPFDHDVFDFGNDDYFKELAHYGENISNLPELRKTRRTARGPRDAIYINRTYFGLYNLLNKLDCEVRVTRPDWLN